MIKGFFHYITFLLAFVLLCAGKKGNEEYSHPLYVAVTEINYDNADKFATIICKTFTDDLDLALQKRYHTKGNFDSPGDLKKLSLEIEEYIKMRLQLKINDKPVVFAFTDFKKEDNTIWSYFRVDNVSAIRKIEITDTIFYELYDNQIQIVYITVNGNRKSNRLTNPESKLAFDF